MSFEALAEDVEFTIGESGAGAAGAGRPLDGRHGGADACCAAGRTTTRAAVLSCTSPAFGNPAGDFQKKFVADRLAPLDAGKTMADVAPGAADGMMGPNADPAGRALFIEQYAAVPEATYRAAVKCLVTFDERANLPSIKVPVLCLAAEHDRNAPPPVLEKMASKIPGAYYFCLSGLGHMPNLEAPAGFRRARSSISSTHALGREGLIALLRMNHSVLDTHDRDAPIFAPDAFRLGDEEAALIDKARRFGARVLGAARRAARPRRDLPDREFPRHASAKACSRICMPKEHGGARRRLPHLCLAAAELGRYCGATALSWNMHVCSTLWTGALADDLEMSAAERAEHNARRAAALPPHRRGRRDLFAAVLRRRRGGGRRAPRSAPRQSRSTAACSSTARRSSPRSRAPPTTTACSAPSAPKARRRAAATRSISRCPANAPGVSVVGDWDPLGMRGTVSRTLLLKDVFVPESELLMPHGVYFQRRDLAGRTCS